MKLWVKIFLGLALGIIFGVIFGDKATIVKPIGDLFLNAIKMLIVPLVFSSLFVGITSLKDPQKLGRIGLKTIILYLFTTSVAITIGLVIAKLIPAGVGMNLPIPDAIPMNESLSLVQTIINIVPKNPVLSLVNGNILQIIFFAIVLGLATNFIGEKGDPLIKIMSALAEAMYKLTDMIIRFAPYGVFAIMAWVAGKYGFAVLLPLIKVIAGVYIACFIHMFVFMGGAVSIIAKLKPFNFFRGITDAQMVAFSTTSSSGTLPVTIECAQKNLGVSNSVSSFVLPLGATINMDGTALYQGVCAIFVANAYGVDLTFAHYLTIIFTATLASIGTAGVPGAGLIMLSLILNSVGLPMEGLAFIAGIDRVLDMARTTVNVTGDSLVSLLIAKSEDELDEKVYNKENEI